ncbi:alpha-ketoglutarate-dependent dioxygenase AlkB family protein [Flavobacterium selenitireducens]|uniref:alpha-ketoglutarate-dependent dioxygenase AlkB family protein n=1 Tax=Flavobacterium selenitireducens TaxID=2722704 RepID=UPI00168B6215|nr:alpha-ketoglutarate-dependent dioxygenase AlkB [Flavobacterium selenitireducens]MBD3583594.1 alpha-ketoglutarate-dependent dioxygenase AlkB [Flavobacterium selenitireducens]
MTNLLPKDGVVHYFASAIPDPDAYFAALLRTIDWKNDEVSMFGKRIITKRKTAWYGDKPFDYTYSKIMRTALPWTTELLQLKAIVEKISSETYNSCLLNLYHDGSEGMGWHSDDEKEIVRHSAIASVSLGATRKFALKHKASKESVSLELQNGSLLVMKGETQESWLHAVPKSSKITEARINLTFRKMA